MSATTASERQAQLLSRYEKVRQRSEQICSPLYAEDYVVQTCYEVSPMKWHLAHTTWFWEHFLLQHYLDAYQHFHPRFHYLFNSYYESEGQVFDKGFRGALSRPTVAAIYSYRRHVDDGMTQLLSYTDEALLDQIAPLVQLGIAHEEQHQELMLMDIKHIFSLTPELPAYQATPPTAPQYAPYEPSWQTFEGGLVTIGHAGEAFAFDNEAPAHQTYLYPFALQSRLVTNGEFLEFIEAGGYKDSRFWLADGWDTLQEEGWHAPLYWHRDGEGTWWEFTLQGLQPLNPNAPVVHLSFYEAHAYATWLGYRLPEEQELELALRSEAPTDGNFYDDGWLTARPAPPGQGMRQLYGDAWEWTQSAYKPYPGYKQFYEGTGEYNGKFMLNQLVLRGGSCLTPRAHIRPTYRNFFYPQNRWQVSGFRLAKTLG